MNSAKSAGDAKASGVWSKVRFVLFVLVGLAICVVTIVYLHNKWEERVRRAEREIAKNRVPVSEVEIDERKLLRKSDAAPYSTLGASRALTGRVRNKSTHYELSAIQVELTLKDCVEKDCEIVGQSTETITLEIPPGQSRDFRETFFFKPTLGNPRGRFVWSHRVVQTCSNSGLRTRPCRGFLF